MLEERYRQRLQRAWQSPAACPAQLWARLTAGLLLVALSAAAVPTSLGSVKSASVHNSHELQHAFADSSIGQIFVASDILLEEATWARHINVTRDVVVTGPSDPERWPLLDLNFLSCRLTMSNGVTVTFRYMYLRRFKSAAENSGMSIFCATPAGGPPAQLVTRDHGIVSTVCPALDVVRYNANQTGGTSYMYTSVIWPICRTPSMCSQPVCWEGSEGAGHLILFAAFPALVADSARQGHLPANYEWTSTNQLFLCGRTFDLECVKAHGFTACAGETQPAGDDPDFLTKFVIGSAGCKQRRTGGISRAATIGTIIGSVIGTLLVATATAVAFMQWYRPQPQHQHKDCSTQQASSNHQPEPALTSAATEDACGCAFNKLGPGCDELQPQAATRGVAEQSGPPPPQQQGASRGSSSSGQAPEASTLSAAPTDVAPVIPTAATATAASTTATTTAAIAAATAATTMTITTITAATTPASDKDDPSTPGTIAPADAHAAPSSSACASPKAAPASAAAAQHQLRPPIRAPLAAMEVAYLPRHQRSGLLGGGSQVMLGLGSGANSHNSSQLLLSGGAGTAAISRHGSGKLGASSSTRLRQTDFPSSVVTPLMAAMAGVMLGPMADTAAAGPGPGTGGSSARPSVCLAPDAHRPGSPAAYDSSRGLTLTGASGSTRSAASAGKSSSQSQSSSQTQANQGPQHAMDSADHARTSSVTAAADAVARRFDLRLSVDVHLEAASADEIAYAAHDPVKQLQYQQQDGAVGSALPFQQLAVLGCGVSGWVVRGTYQGVPVAVKLMNAWAAVGHNVDMEQVHREVEVMCRCEHPNIVRLLGAGLGADQRPPFLVLELMAGGSLHKLIHGEGEGEGDEEGADAKAAVASSRPPTAPLAAPGPSPPTGASSVVPSNLNHAIHACDDDDVDDDGVAAGDKNRNGLEGRSESCDAPDGAAPSPRMLQDRPSPEQLAAATAVCSTAASKRLSLLQALSIARDVAMGLAYLHPVVVHRDLKPSNVLLDAVGRAKLTDFGLSRSGAVTHMTAEPTAGTAAYIAPELFQGSGATVPVTAAHDMYAFGVLVWEMMTGQRPWPGLSMLQLAYCVTVKEMSLAVPDAWPPRLRKLVEGCFSRDPRARPSAAEAVKILTMLIKEQQQQQQQQGQQTPQELYQQPHHQILPNGDLQAQRHVLTLHREQQQQPESDADRTPRLVSGLGGSASTATPPLSAPSPMAAASPAASILGGAAAVAAGQSGMSTPNTNSSGAGTGGSSTPAAAGSAGGPAHATSGLAAAAAAGAAPAAAACQAAAPSKLRSGAGSDASIRSATPTRMPAPTPTPTLPAPVAASPAVAIPPAAPAAPLAFVASASNGAGQQKQEPGADDKDSFENCEDMIDSLDLLPADVPQLPDPSANPRAQHAARGGKHESPVMTMADMLDMNAMHGNAPPPPIHVSVSTGNGSSYAGGPKRTLGMRQPDTYANLTYTHQRDAYGAGSVCSPKGPASQSHR